jgi:ParB-like chromosome segregation protein Spo0J
VDDCVNRDFGEDWQFLRDNKHDLIESIARQGMVIPLVAKVLPDGYRIDEGNHRSGIAKMLGFKTIPVILLDEITE